MVKNLWKTDKRYEKAAKTFFANPNLSVTKSMLAEKFSEDEAEDETKQMRVRRLADRMIDLAGGTTKSGATDTDTTKSATTNTATTVNHRLSFLSPLTPATRTRSAKRGRYEQNQKIVLKEIAKNMPMDEKLQFLREVIGEEAVAAVASTPTKETEEGDSDLSTVFEVPPWAAK